MENNQTHETISAFCDICDNQTTADKTLLENQGWYLGSREEFCPECND